MRSAQPTPRPAPRPQALPVAGRPALRLAGEEGAAELWPNAGGHQALAVVASDPYGRRVSGSLLISFLIHAGILVPLVSLLSSPPPQQQPPPPEPPLSLSLMELEQPPPSRPPPPRPEARPSDQDRRVEAARRALAHGHRGGATQLAQLAQHPSSPPSGTANPSQQAVAVPSPSPSHSAPQPVSRPMDLARPLEKAPSYQTVAAIQTATAVTPSRGELPTPAKPAAAAEHGVGLPRLPDPQASEALAQPAARPPPRIVSARQDSPAFVRRPPPQLAQAKKPARRAFRPALGAVAVMPPSIDAPADPTLPLAPRSLSDTQRNLLYAYLLRIRQRVEPVWNPLPIVQAALARDPALGHQDHLELWIYLRVDASGDIDDLRLVRSSGLAALDHHALASVREVGSFLAPPTRLLDEGGGLGFTYGARTYLGQGAAGP